ncbi:plasmid mobilization relaxosome protein MobC [Streptomyces cellulosae]
MARIGNNINQIAYVHNVGGQSRPGELGHALATLTRLLARVDDAADAMVRRRT